jgi:hypothetical protein
MTQCDTHHINIRCMETVEDWKTALGNVYSNADPQLKTNLAHGDDEDEGL